MEKFGIAIHGGAGTISKKNLSPEMERAYKDKLTESLMKGHALLKAGGTSIQAVEAAIKILEDSPLFNAGKGSVFNSEGEIEMDAAIMEGQFLKAGAVAGLKRIKNPICAAKVVMEKTPHVFVIGEGAENLVKKYGIEFEEPAYFYEEKRWQQLQKVKGSEIQQLDHTEIETTEGDHKYGTVGAVALDTYGNLAAGSSTGGLTNKKPGRVGDSPVIGAGTYANNQTCAVAATGEGEYFIRAVVGHDISALMEYKGWTIQQATQEVIANKMTQLGGRGGVISIDKEANISIVFNTKGMYRAFVKQDEKPEVLIYKE
jgi:beta-aspartyl-peptidase (threonine type)